MNKDNAKDYLPLVQALAEGKTIQHCKVSGEASSDYWQDCIAPTFGDKASRYRIKPEPKKAWYRDGLWEDGTGRYYVLAANSEASADQHQESRLFVKWLTDRIEYELPEGDA